jgi:hypothetical protein
MILGPFGSATADEHQQPNIDIMPCATPEMNANEGGSKSSEDPTTVDLSEIMVVAQSVSDEMV